MEKLPLINKSTSYERGFTLIELLTVIAILSVLSALSLKNVADLKDKAAYAGVQILMSEVKTDVIGAIINDPDNPPAAASHTQTGGGSMTDPAARNLVPSVRLNEYYSLSIDHDPGCTVGACSAETATIRSCKGHHYASWSRFGDGTEIMLERLPGAGC